MADVSRRQFSQQMVGSLLTFSLLETLCSQDLFSAEVKPIVAKWVKDLDAMGKELRGSKLSQVQWQKQVETLFDQIELEQLLTFIDFKKRTTNFQFRDKGERSMRFKFPEVEGLPTQLVFGHQMFGMKKNQSVVPHGHNNMATAFLVLRESSTVVTMIDWKTPRITSLSSQRLMASSRPVLTRPCPTKKTTFTGSRRPATRDISLTFMS